jgi:hypothetical protein
MELERPKVDRAVLSFLKLEALHPADERRAAVLQKPHRGSPLSSPF